MKYTKILIVPLLIIGLFTIISCENETFDGITEEKIQVDSELYTSLEQLIGKDTEQDTICVTFIYPFNVYLYGENEAIIGSRIVENNIDFISLLDTMNSEESVGLSYPISTITDEGDTFAIRSNRELSDVIRACIEEEIIHSCNGFIEERRTCVWTISSDDTNRYNDAIINFYPNGEGIFYDLGTAYRMSWVPLVIEEELHINIKLEGDSEVAQYWNFDWNASIISDTDLNLTRDDISYTIRTECDLDNQCEYVEFRECTSEFDLGSYSDCIVSLQEDIESTENLNIYFYETKEDQNVRMNYLDDNVYTIEEETKLIFVSLIDPIAEVYKDILIVLIHEECEQN